MTKKEKNKEISINHLSQPTDRPIRFDVTYHERVIVHRRAPRVTLASTCALHVVHSSFPSLFPPSFSSPRWWRWTSRAKRRSERTLRNSATSFFHFEVRGDRHGWGSPGVPSRGMGRERGPDSGAASRSNVYFHLTRRRRGHPLSHRVFGIIVRLKR